MGKGTQAGNGAGSGSTNLSLFWMGAGIGFVMSGVTVLVISELIFRGRLRHMPHTMEADYSLDDNLGSAMQYGASVLVEAAEKLASSFQDARSELIRFGLGVEGAGSDESGWYMDDSVEPSKRGKVESDVDFEFDEP